MTDFELTEEQAAIRTLARDFAVKEIAPLAEALDKAPDPAGADVFPWEMVKKGSQLGLRTLSMPEEYGGPDADVITMLLALEQLAAADMSCAKILSHVWRGIEIIARGGTQEQKDRFLPEIRDDDTCLISLAFTEPDCGCDNALPYEGADGGMRLTAEHRGDGYILNGLKHFISLGPQAKLVITGGRVDKSVGGRTGVGLFLVPKDTPGLSVGKIDDRICLHAYPGSELNFDNVYLPQENYMGTWNDYIKATRGFSLGNLELAVCSMALARNAFKAALDFAKEKVQGGKRIIEHQAVAIRMSDMYMSIQAGDSLIWRTAAAVNRGKSSAAPLVIAVKVFCADTAVNITLQALQIFGGLGVMRELPIERYFRDSLMPLHGSGTADVLRIKLNSLLAGEAVIDNIL